MNKKIIIKNIIAAVLIFAFFFSAFLNDNWGLIISIISVILVIGLFIAILGLIHYLCCKELLLSKKAYLKISGIVIMIGFLLLVTGGITAFLGVGFDGLYEVDQVRVIKKEKSKIIIDYTEYNNDDYTEKTINKPFYANPKEGKLIYVRYPKNKPYKMHYILGPKNAGKIVLLGLKNELFGGLIVSIYVLARKIPKKKGNRK